MSVSRIQVLLWTSLGAMVMIAPIPTHADNTRLTKQQIIECLSGHTAIGRRQGVDFCQYFDEHGKFHYRDRSGKSAEGLWRVTDNNEYCAWWADSGWACFSLFGEGDRITWRDQAGEVPVSAVMVSGDHQKDCDGDRAAPED